MRKYFVVCVALLMGVSLLLGAQDAKEYEGTTLKVLIKVGYETAVIENFVDVFEETTGIDIEYEVYDEPTMRQKIVLDATSGAGAYDIFAVQYWNFPEYRETGWLEPVTTLDEGLCPFDFSWDAVPVGAQGLYSDGTDIYAVPASLTGAGALIYRTDILEKWNLSPPQTVRDVVAIAMFLKEHEPDIYPFCQRGTAGFASFGSVAGWAWPYGARVLSDGEVTVDTPEMLAAMEDYVALLKDYGPPGQASIGWEQMSELYRAGKVAMTMDMMGFPSVFANPDISEVAGKIGVALLTGPAGNYAQWNYSEGLGISRFSKNKEAARLFLQWRSSLDTFKREVEAGIRVDFPNELIYETQEYKDAIERLGLQFLAEAIPETIKETDPGYWPFVPEFVQVADAFMAEISLAIAGEQSVAEALAKAQKGVEAVFE